MAINTISELRTHIIDTLDKLTNNKIDIAAAIAASKLYSNIIDTVKCEIDYQRVEGEIAFLQPTTIQANKPAAAFPSYLPRVKTESEQALALRDKLNY